MSQVLPRFSAAAQRIADAEKLGRILRETGEVTVAVGRATAGGDDRRLRGIPCIARGVAGVSPGTDPILAVRRV